MTSTIILSERRKIVVIRAEPSDLRRTKGSFKQDRVSLAGVCVCVSVCVCEENSVLVTKAKVGPERVQNTEFI